MSEANERTGPIQPRQFRLGDETLADLDYIAEQCGRESGVPHTRTDAVRVAARREADRLEKKAEKK